MPDNISIEDLQRRYIFDHISHWRFLGATTTADWSVRRFSIRWHLGQRISPLYMQHHALNSQLSHKGLIRSDL
jgi:hypothetical protein